MIERLSLGGPIALTRAFAISPAADLPADRSRDRVTPPDPNAPSGPAPSFKTSHMEALRAAMRTEQAPVPGDEARYGSYGTPAPEVAGKIDTFA